MMNTAGYTDVMFNRALIFLLLNYLSIIIWVGSACSNNKMLSIQVSRNVPITNKDIWRTGE